MIGGYNQVILFCADDRFHTIQKGNEEIVMQVSEQYANDACLSGRQVPGGSMWHVPQIAHNLMQAVGDLGGNRRVPINISTYRGNRDTCLSGHIADGNGRRTPGHCCL
jgi:hypothetical protein